MAIYLEANYSKKLGLPSYSSHQYSLTIRTELGDPAQVQAESSRIYNLLQTCVDREIQNTGFLPQSNGSGKGGTRTAPAGNGNGSGHVPGAWSCSKKQQALILKLVEENSLDQGQVEGLAQAKFGKSVQALNKLEASGLIDELHAQIPGNSDVNQRWGYGGRATGADAR